MNKTHRLVWNETTRTWVATAETARSRGKRSTGALTIACALLPPAALAQPAPTALPSGGQVVAGQAAIHQNGAAMTVQQGSDRAAIDWQQFNVGRDARVQFQQPSAQSVTLNRVQGPDASQIFGRITANGQVFLSNPNGVYFAPGARVDVGGLVATTHRISLEDFMAGRTRFERQGATGSVVNEGELRAALGGYIALLAPEVRNQGLVIANLGTVALAAGEAFELQFDANHTLASLRVEASTLRAIVDNRSAVLAPGGLVILSAQALDRVQGGVVRNSGRIEATGLAQRGGRIVLEASGAIANSGSISANATTDGPAGSVRLQAPEVVNSGSITAAGSAAHPQGGGIEIVAGDFTQTATGSIDASAPVQGGRVQVRASGAVELAGQVTVAATQAPPAPAAAPTVSGQPPADAPAPARGGEIDVQASKIHLPAATLDASGGDGGRIALHASAPAAPAPAAPVPVPAPERGQVLLQGATQLSTRGRRGQGGSITLLGDDLRLQEHTALDARGATGGGRVRVGGGWQGGEGLYQATTVALDSGARIDASATEQGDGGSVVLWSDVTRDGSLTTAHGELLARAAGPGGQGGRIETSGHQVDTQGVRVDAGAPQGTGGLWLVDPYNYTIGSTQAATIAGTLNTGTSVIVTTEDNTTSQGASGNSGDVGNISVNSSISKTSGGDATLTLKAHGDITFNGASVTSSSGKLNLVLWSDWDSSNGGAIWLNGSSTAISVTTNGGHVWMGGNGYTAAGSSTTWNGLNVGTGVANSQATTTVFEGVNLNRVTLNTGGGHLSVAGTNNRYNSGEARLGVVVSNGSSVSTGIGSITVQGTLRERNDTLTTYADLYGVRIDSASLSSTGGAISIVGGDAATNTDNKGLSGYGVQLRNASVTSVSGAIDITGMVGVNNTSGGETRAGIRLEAAGDNTRTTVSSTSGNVTLTGTSYATNHAAGSGISMATSKAVNDDANHAAVKVVSQTGQVTLVGDSPHNDNTGSSGIAFNGDYYGRFFLGADESGPTHSSKLTLSASGLHAFNMAGGALRLLGSGELAIEPLGDSFKRGSNKTPLLDFNVWWNFGSSHKALTLGKEDNNSDITVSNALSAAGPMHIHGRNLAVNANLTTTAAGGAILLKARGDITTNASRTLKTNNGDLTLWSDSDGTGGGAITLGQGNTLNTANGLSSQSTGGGAITLGGGSAITLGGGSATATTALGSTVPTGAANSSTGNGITINFQDATLETSIISGGGAIRLVGSSSATNGMGIIWSERGKLDAGNGTLYLEGSIGSSNNTSVNGHGIELGAFGGTTTLRAGGGNAGNAAITLLGTYHGSSAGWAGVQTNGGWMQATGAGGITVTAMTPSRGTGNSLNLGLDALAASGPIALTAEGRSGVGLRYGGKIGKAATTTNDNNNNNSTSEVTSSSSAVTLTGDALVVNGSIQVDTSGTLTVQPVNASFSSALAWPMANFSVANITGLTLGKAGNTANITVNSAQTVAGPIRLIGGDLTLEAGLTATGSTVTLQASGSVSDTGSGFVSASGLLLVGGNVLLDSASTNIGTLAASGVASLDVRHSGALTIGTVSGTTGISATGPVAVSTESGDLTLAALVETTHTGTSAIVLNAGRATGAGTATGGNLIVSGSPSVSTGASGRATLYSGSVAGSTGLTALVGSGSGRFRYNSDESATNYSTALGSGLYGIYRERPTVSLGWNNQSMVYGTAQPANAYTVNSGSLVNGDVPTATLSGSVLSGAGRLAVSGSPYAVTDSGALQALGYNATVTHGSLTVTPRTLTASFTGVDKVYDGGTAATVTLGDDRLAGDAMSLAYGSAGFLDKQAGSGKTVNVSGLTLSGADAGNYTLAATSGSTTAAITPRSLTVTWSGVDKVYDGSTTASVGASDNRLSGDVFTVSRSAAFADANAGNGKAVSVTGVSLSGADALNYSVATTGSTTAAITPKTLTLTASKVYDGSTALGAGTVSLGGLVGSETLGYSGGAASDAHVATTGKYVSSLTLLDGTNGGLAANYALPTLNAANAPVTITPRALTATAAIGGTTTKTYDGTTAASGATVNGSISGAIAGDALALVTSGLTLSYDSAHVVSASQIAATGSTGFTIGSSSSGSQASDYSFTAPTIAAVAGSITPKALTAAASIGGTLGKVYDGSDAASGATVSGSVSGAIAGDALALDTSALTLAYNSAHVANATQIAASGSAGFIINGSTSGSQASDYSFTAPTIAAVAGSITPKALTASASIGGTTTKTYDGSTAASGATVSGSVSGAIAGDALALDTSTLTLVYDSAHVVGATQIAASGSAGFVISASVSGSQASDYSFTAPTIAPVAGSITPKALTAAASIGGTLTKVYDGSAAAPGATVSGNVGGAIAGDTLALNASGLTLSYDSAHVASATQIAASGSAGFVINGSASGSQASDYSFTGPSIAAVAGSITPKALTATAAIGGTTSKVYDGTTAAIGNTVSGSISGAIAGDTLALDASGLTLAYDSAHVASASRISASGSTGFAIGASSSGSQASDYSFSAPSIASVTASITPKTVTVSGLTAASKVYDGTDTVTLTHIGSLSGLVGSETLGLSLAQATFDSAQAGSGKTVTASGYLLSNGGGGNGGLTSNYQLASTSATTTADITKAVLTVIANNDARFVTQADASGYAGVVYSGFAAGETAAVLSGAATVTRSNPGDNAAGHYAGVLVPDTSGLSSGNYSFVARNGDFTIVPAGQLLVRVAPTTTAYGNASQYTLASAQYLDNGNVIRNVGITSAGGDRFTLDDGVGGSATLTLVPAGAGTSSAGWTRVGAWQLAPTNVSTQNAGNFSNTLTVVGSETVVARAVSISASGGISKVYDGTVGMQGLSLQINGAEAADQLSVNATGSFASKNAGSNLAYTITGVALTGADADNYTLANGGVFGGSNGSITPRSLTTTYTGVNKVYDGSTTANVIVGDNRIAGDTLTVQVTANFSDKNVGAGKQVTVTGASLAGTDASNYTLTASGGSTTADITRLNSVTWIGGASGNWFDPANWAGGAVPDLANVANVVIPAGVVVRFDTAGAVAPAQTGPVQIDSLGGTGGGLVQANGALDVGSGGVALASLTQQGGVLNSAGNIALNDFSQTGGDTRTQGNLTVDGQFNQGPNGSVAVGGNTTITDTAGGTTIGNLQTGGNLAITSTAGDIMQAAGTTIVANGTTTIDAGGSNVTLDGAANDFRGPLNATGQNITVVDGTGGLVIGNIAASGALNATSTGGDVTQQAGSVISVSGDTTVSAGGSNITLDGAANDFKGPLNASGANVTVLDGTGGLVLGNIAASGGLTATSTGGNVTQQAGSAISVNGATTLDAGSSNITLDGASNDFKGPLNASGANVTVVDSTGGLVLGNIAASGGLTATSTGGNVTQQAGSTISVNGATTLDAAGSNITLDGASNDFKGPLNASGANVTVVDGTGGLVLGNITANGALNATSTGGDVTQQAGSAISVNGATTLDAAGSNITLDGAANDFKGPLNASGANVTVVDGTGGLIIGNITANGSLNATSTGGAVTQQAGSVISVNGMTTLDAGGSNVSLNGAANDFRGPLNATGQNITVVDGTGGLVIGNIAATGGLNATSTGGDVTQQAGSAISVSGDTTVSAAGSNITLNGAANDFRGPLNATGQNITVVDGTGGLVLGNIAATGSLNATSTGGGITQSSGSRLVVQGTAALSSPGFRIDLATAGNSFGAGLLVNGMSLSSQTPVPLVLPPVVPPTPLPVPATAPLAIEASALRVGPAGPTVATAGSGTRTAQALGDGVAVRVLDDPRTQGTGLVAVQVPRQMLATGFSFALPEALTAGLPPDTPVTATLESGEPLPAWLQFDAQRRRFSATAVPENGLPLRLRLRMGDRTAVILVTAAAATP